MSNPKPITPHIIRRDYNNTYRTESGGWCKDPEKAQTFDTPEVAQAVIREFKSLHDGHTVLPLGSSVTVGCNVTLPPAAQALENRDRDLNKLASEGKTIQSRIQKKSADLIYEVVDFGLRLIKAKDVHQCDTVSRRLSNGQLGEGEGGFHKWIEAHFPKLEIRTAQRYINAALNAGLSAGSPLNAVRRIRQERLLHEKQLTDLYRPPRQLTNGLEQEPAPEAAPNAVRDTLREFGSLCDSVVQLRDQMSPKEYEAAIDRLKDTLQLLTDCEWSMEGSSVTLAPAKTGAKWNSPNGVQRHAAAARAGQKAL